MLKESRGTDTGFAWLVGDRFEKALKVHARSPAPHPENLSLFAPDFALSDPEPWLVGEAQSFQWPEAAVLPALTHRVDPSSADFQREVEEILARIRSGEFAKVVPMVCDELEFEAPLTRAMFRPRSRPEQFLYGFEFEGEGMVGQTPELLFEVREGVLTTMALAGTGPVEGPSLLEDRKERHEHGLVIEHIREVLAAWGEVEVGETFEHTYGRLKHLRTPLQARLRETPDFMELVVKLHPTAALGGWPRRPAIEWLERQPFHTTRGRFGAPFGFREGDHMVCVVAIRGLQWKANRARVSAGCGVVEGSDPLKEWRELKLKREAIYALLGVTP